MPQPRHQPTNGKPKLLPLVEACLMKRAAIAGPRRAFDAHKADYDAGRSHKSPDPTEYGLPRDHGIPSGPR